MRSSYKNNNKRAKTTNNALVLRLINILLHRIQFVNWKNERKKKHHQTTTLYSRKVLREFVSRLNRRVNMLFSIRSSNCLAPRHRMLSIEHSRTRVLLRSTFTFLFHVSWFCLIDEFDDGCGFIVIHFHSRSSLNLITLHIQINEQNKTGTRTYLK